MSSPLWMWLATAEAWMRMTHPDRMCEPAWRAGPSWICAVALVKGAGVPSESGIVRIPEAPQGLPQGLELVLGQGLELGLGPAPIALGY